MGKGTPKTKRQASAARAPLVVRTTPQQETPLMENEDALASLGRLARRYQLPSLERAVSQIQRDLQPGPQPA